jgi:hypothetical protein
VEAVRTQATQEVVIVPDIRQAPVQAAQSERIGAISSSIIPSQSSSMLLQVSIQAAQAIQEFQVRTQAEHVSVPAI